MSEISNKDVEKVARLAKIEVDQSQIVDLTDKMTKIVDFAEKLKISTIDLSDTRNFTVEIPIWEEFGDNKKKNVGHDNLKEITLDRLDEIFEQVLKSLPNDKIYYSFVFTGGGAKIKNFYNYFIIFNDSFLF